jgi:hypothetical protein
MAAVGFDKILGIFVTNGALGFGCLLWDGHGNRNTIISLAILNR